jgi:hypothetical protein
MPSLKGNPPRWQPGCGGRFKVNAWSAFLCLFIIALKWTLLGRVRPGQHALWSCWCSRWDFLYVAWGQYGRFALQKLAGTLLLLNWYLRAMGAKLGKRVVLGPGFSQVVDPDMIVIEDGATVNAMFQAHTFEDRVLKTDHVIIHRSATMARWIASGGKQWQDLGMIAGGGVVEVGNDAELREALVRLESGTTLRIAPGQYRGGLAVRGVERLVVEAADPERPPEFVGGANAWQFSRCDGLIVRNLVCRKQTGNGLNIDDGGELECLVRGNFDGIKCSGLADLVIEDCRIEGWGGQAIDFVGCRKALIRRCRIIGRDGFSQATGPQFKGGSEGVVIEDCVLINAGQRPIHAGGSTGVDYFRPPGAKYEARSITIRRNVIVGGDCAAAFTGVDGAVFERNVVVNPTHWVFRILQETRMEGFAPCRNVVLRGNVMVFRRAGLRTEVNVGDGTAPETFRFERNWWFAEDAPQRSRPTLPGRVIGDVHGEDPMLDPDTRLPGDAAALRLLGR